MPYLQSKVSRENWPIIENPPAGRRARRLFTQRSIFTCTMEQWRGRLRVPFSSGQFYADKRNVCYWISRLLLNFVEWNSAPTMEWSFASRRVNSSILKRRTNILARNSEERIWHIPPSRWNKFTSVHQPKHSLFKVESVFSSLKCHTYNCFGYSSVTRVAPQPIKSRCKDHVSIPHYNSDCPPLLMHLVNTDSLIACKAHGSR